METLTSLVPGETGLIYTDENLVENFIPICPIVDNCLPAAALAERFVLPVEFPTNFDDIDRVTPPASLFSRATDTVYVYARIFFPAIENVLLDQVNFSPNAQPPFVVFTKIDGHVFMELPSFNDLGYTGDAGSQATLVLDLPLFIDSTFYDNNTTFLLISRDGPVSGVTYGVTFVPNAMTNQIHLFLRADSSGIRASVDPVFELPASYIRTTVPFGII
jgi:hypothetical protein